MARSEMGADCGSSVAKRQQRTALYIDIEAHQWPIIYSPEYNITFMGLEKLHPFDSSKWGKIYDFLKKAGMIEDSTIVRPLEAEPSDLLTVHTRRYLNGLKWSIKVAGITEVPPVAFLPNYIVQRRVLRPFRFHTGGTVLVTHYVDISLRNMVAGPPITSKLALERGWAINLGGGFHHCSATRGGGFCAYADITIAIRMVLDHMTAVKTVMIIDLDAHQGNGYERDFMDDERVYILDMFNRQIYPHDGFAKRAIRRKVELLSDVGDQEYLTLVRVHVEAALGEFPPDLIVYNAGTDVLEGDMLGHLSLSPEGVIERDQIVFQKARTRDIPIMMLTSGGYQRSTARVIADSILNLHALRLITCDAADNLANTSRHPGISSSQSESTLSAHPKSSETSMPHSQTLQHVHKPDTHT